MNSIQDMTIEELKVIAYDIIKSQQVASQNLGMIEFELGVRANRPAPSSCPAELAGGANVE